MGLSAQPVSWAAHVEGAIAVSARASTTHASAFALSEKQCRLIYGVQETGAEPQDKL